MRNFFIFFLMLALSYTANAGTKVYGYAQITGESGQGVNSVNTTNGGAGTSGLRFGAGAVRIGAKYEEGNTFAHLLLRYDGLNTLPANRVFFAYVGHKFNYGFLNKVMVGQFKNPIGMELNQAPNKMDITKYDVLKSLQGGLVVGGMMGGDLGFGLSYDIAAFNSQNGSSTPGKELGYAFKLAYDLKGLHFQVGYMIDNEKDKIDANKDKDSTLDIGLKYVMNDLTFLAEYVATKNKIGDVEQTKFNAYHVHLGYKVMKNLETVVRYVTYDPKMTSAGVEPGLKLSNIWLGVNFWANANERLQFNYVLASGDKRFETAAVTPLKGIYDANVFLAQYQVNF